MTNKASAVSQEQGPTTFAQNHATASSLNRMLVRGSSGFDKLFGATRKYGMQRFLSLDPVNS